MELYAGIDLHSSNSFIGIIGPGNKRIFGKRLPNDLDQILKALDPYKQELRAAVVESYCRCVNSTRITNGKKKGENNRKNGNKYLSWAYVEAANFARRYCDEAQRFYQRKMAKTNNIVATKALSNKICRASYYVMRDQVPWEVGRVFK